MFALAIGLAVGLLVSLAFGIGSQALERSNQPGPAKVVAIIGGLLAGHLSITVGVTFRPAQPRAGAGVIGFFSVAMVLSLMEWAQGIHEFGLVIALMPAGTCYIVTAVLTMMVYLGSHGSRS